jgi:hypothetical protein
MYFPALLIMQNWMLLLKLIVYGSLKTMLILIRSWKLRIAKVCIKIDIMKFLLTAGFLTAMFFNEGCTSTSTNKTNLTGDTTVGSKVLTNEIAGSAYMKRAKGYFVITNKDTSGFTCIFSEAKESEEISMDIHGEARMMTYRQRMDELKRILPEAAKDFKFDSLKSVYFGRLVENGDIAIEVTKEYRQKFGESNESSKINDHIKDYREVSEFLAKSKLAKDFNELFKPYSISVNKAFVEKVFFTDKGALYWGSKIETDTTAIPNRILDCIIGLGFKKD